MAAVACKRATLSPSALRALCCLRLRATGYDLAPSGLRRALGSLSYCHTPGKQPLLHFTIGDLVDRAADKHGDSIAIVSCHQSIRKTYAEYKTDIDQFASALVSLNLPFGSKVAIMAPNMYEWGVTQFAAAKAGLVLVNLNPVLEVPELEFCLNHTDCEAIIVSEQFARQDYYQMLLQIAPELDSSRPGGLQSTRLPKLKHVILIGDQRKSGAVTYCDMLNSITSKQVADMQAMSSKLQMDDPINLQFTSGTTGKPKAAQLSHFNVVNNAYLIGKTLELNQEHQVLCLNVPLMHCYGYVGGSLAAMIFASTLVMPAPSFKGDAALNSITNERCTLLYGTPTMYIDMMHQFDKERHDVSSVRRAVMAGAPCPPEVNKKVMTELNARRLFIMYGSTEASPVITGTTPDDPLDQWIDSVGKPLEHTEVKIVDGDKKIVPVNGKGELCVRGYGVFSGYYNDEEKTREVVHNGWYHTGDEAVMNKSGRVYIRGRIKDMIIRGGENIYPKEIEDFLYTHHAVEEVQVVGVPDERLGEQVCAWIKLKSGCNPSEEDIKDFCKGKLSYFKIPRYILFVDNFPKTVSGKVQKFKMREQSRAKLHL